MKNPSARRSRVNAKFLVKFGTCILLIIVGSIMAAPYVINTFIVGSETHYLTLWIFLSMLGLMFGGPLFVSGIIGFLVSNKRHRSSSTSELDIGRIRYTVETDSRSKK